MPTFEYEYALMQEGKKHICGIDEAGRGPLAGPLVVAACILPSQFYEGVCPAFVKELNDSKKLSELKREDLYEALIEHPEVKTYIQIIEPRQIDTLNILEATLYGMAEAAVGVRCEYALVDGNRVPNQISVEAQAIVKGDQKSYSIAAASVLAKVTRDRLMIEIDQEFPEYGFKRHKGYGTKVHLEALEKYGATPHHRFSFAPVRKTLKSTASN